MTSRELLDCLTDRPCEVCKFHKEKGCSKWDCVFEEQIEDSCDITIETINQYCKEHNYVLCEKGTEHGKMLVCPKCGLDVHSDFKYCPRCGERMKEGD